MSGFYVICEARGEEFRPATYELLAVARAITATTGGEVTAVVAGPEVTLKAKLDGLAHRVLALTAPELTPFSADPWVEALGVAIAAVTPRAVLFGEGGRTREVMPRLAARLGAWALTNCVDLRVSGEGTGASDEGAALEISRPVYGGKAYVTNTVPADGLLLAAFRPHSFDAGMVPAGLTTAVEEVAAPVAASRVELVERREGGTRKADLTEAAVVVTGGRGMKGPENFGLLEDLAAALEGAVGYSRALVDAGLAEHAYQVGKSGKTVSPTLYIACGVSGAIHHTMGMDTAKVVVAINTDPKAPIFEYADYGVVGDVLQVLPALTEQVRAATS